MDCLAVRDLLAEHVLGTLDPEARRLVDRHLAWCAGCRKEAAQLAEGAAGLAMAMSGPEPPADLEDRLVDAVSSGGRRPHPRPRGRSRGALVAAALAAVLAMGSVAWAVTLAGRVDELEGRAAVARGRVARFEQVIRELGGRERVRGADLFGRPGADGRALVYDGDQDWVLVVATGLPEAGGPYQAYLTTSGGRVVVGRLASQAPGELATARLFPGAVSPFRGVLVVDASGAPVLEGTLASSAA
ncbi:MAG TPA: zf-HC2 domain-containing protein [Actinomycetota bacterium]|nr:zf-HC2 domain-containing protein [Actinomycetota bacterium]